MEKYKIYICRTTAEHRLGASAHSCFSSDRSEGYRNSEGFSTPGRENGYCLDARQTLIMNDIYLIFLISF